jgi:dTDP-4-dehydrorhamnose reductase
MAPPKILLFGKVGQVGWELRRTLAPLGPLVCVDFPEVDFTNPDSIRKWIQDTSPEIIVNAAAYTAVDKAESEPALATTINGEAPGIIAEAARQRGALLVHYSTDYVFDGTKTTPYVEDDRPNPLGAYGRSKLAGDTAIQQVGGRHLIFRLCWVYGPRGSNFMLTMMRLARERESLRVVSDQIGCPTTSRLIAEATALALQQARRSDPAVPCTGVYHLCCAGQASWHEFARAIIDQMPAAGRKCRTIEAITAAEYPTPAKRPAYSVMSCAKLQRTFGLALPEWQDALRLVLES